MSECKHGTFAANCIDCWKERAEKAEADLKIVVENSSSLTKEQEIGLRVQLKAAEAACAEMRPIIEEANEASKLYAEHEGRYWHALSSDCGRDFVPRAELEKAQAACAALATSRKEMISDLQLVLDSINARGLPWAFVQNEISVTLFRDAQRCVTKKIPPDCGKGWMSPEQVDAGVAGMKMAIAELRNERDSLQSQLTSIQSKYDAALADWHRSDTKLAAAVEALERVPCTCADIRIGSDEHDDSCAERLVREALAKIKDDSAPSELADTKRRLESCLSLLGHACGTSPSPTWPYVLEFARRMEKKLDANRHKGNREGWINDDPASLIRRIQGETDELIGEIHKGQNAQRIADEAADIANFCMMAADWFLARKEPPKNQP